MREARIILCASIIGMKSSIQIFKDSLILFRAHWGMYVLFLMTPTFVNLAAQYIVLPSIIAIGALIIAILGGSKIVTMIMVGLGVIIAFAAFLAMIAFGFAGRMIIPLSSHKYDQGLEVDFMNMWKETFKKVLSYIWVSILVMVVVIAGLVLGIIPGIFFCVWFIFATFSNLIDDKKGLQALVFSKQLVSGRAWRVIGKLLFPLVAILGYILAAVLVGLIIALLFKKIVILGILLMIPFVIVVFLGMIALSVVIMIYFYKLYKELTLTLASSPVVATPAWLKVMTWIGGLIIIFSPIILAGVIWVNPEARAEIKYVIDEIKEGVESADAPSGSESVIIKDGTYSGYGINFSYPESSGWKYVNAGTDPLSFAHFVDENTKVVNAGAEDVPYHAIIDAKMFNPGRETKKMSAYEIAEESFTPVMEEFKAEGSVEEYTFSKETINGIEVGILDYADTVEGQTVIGRWVVVKSDSAVYAFLAQAVEGNEASSQNALKNMLETIKFSKYRFPIKSESNTESASVIKSDVINKVSEYLRLN